MVLLQLSCLLIYFVGFSKTYDLLTNTTNDTLLLEDKASVFISDDIFQGIIPTISESWNTLLNTLKQKVDDPDFHRQEFWNRISLERLKPFHDSIREIDRVIADNKPAAVLNRLVNIDTIEQAFNLSEETTTNEKISWIDVVKDGWIKVAGMMAQVHFKYDWTFDQFYSDTPSTLVTAEMTTLNDVLDRYFAWHNVRDLNLEPKLGSSSSFILLSQHLVSGESLPVYSAIKSLFVGLKDLIKIESQRTEEDLQRDVETEEICTSGEALSGKRPRVIRYLPIYVLLHLLNGEFKYFIMRNVAQMFECVQNKSCTREAFNESADHLKTFYKFYFQGIVKAFREPKADTVSVGSVPKSDWRWACDPQLPSPDGGHVTLKHIEDVTFTRFYDYQTVFLAEEREISLTQTCRDSCDLFDGGYSSVPCDRDDWRCLGDALELDCADLIQQGVQCPQARTNKLCPTGDLKCTTSSMNTAQVCPGQRNWRHIAWLDGGDGKILGKKALCSDRLQNMTVQLLLESAAMTKFEPEKCELCVCKCYEPLTNRTHRYISLEPQVADVDSHKALVGIKFVKIDGVVYPQIAQAKVKYGLPIATTTEWVEPRRRRTVEVKNTASVFRLGRNSNKVLLDDFLAPHGYVITGVRFVKVTTPVKGDYELNSSSGTPRGDMSCNKYDSLLWKFNLVEDELALEAQMTALTDQGDIKPETAIWKSNAQTTSLFRTEVGLEDSDDPTLAGKPSIPTSTANQFVSIQSTSITKDVGQTPIPFLDTQNLIESSNLTLIRGLGLFSKGRPGFGGFLGFRLLPMPISDKPWNRRYDLWHSLVHTVGP